MAAGRVSREPSLPRSGGASSAGVDPRPTVGARQQGTVDLARDGEACRADELLAKQCRSNERAESFGPKFGVGLLAGADGEEGPARDELLAEVVAAARLAEMHQRPV